MLVHVSCTQDKERVADMGPTIVADPFDRLRLKGSIAKLKFRSVRLFVAIAAFLCRHGDASWLVSSTRFILFHDFHLPSEG